MTASVLIGRAHAAALVQGELDRTLGSHGGVVLVAGEAGIGKTALVRDVAAGARSRRAIVAVASSWEADGAPDHWPWVQLVRGLEQAATAEEWSAAHAAAGDGLSDLLGAAPATAGAKSGDELAFWRADAVTTLLVTLARARPVVVVLDDLHWADAASLELLAFVARHTWFEQLLVVGTYRDVEIDAADHPLRTHITALLGSATTVTLTGLEAAEVATLIERVAGEAPDDDLVAEVHRRTGGNPFFVEQMVRLGAIEGALSTVPPGVREVVEARLARLPVAVREVLGFAAAIGREFDQALLAEASGRDVDELAGLLAHALSARLVTKRDATRLAFVHDLVRETLQFTADDATRRTHHAAIATALTERAERGEQSAPGVLARHAHLAVPEIPASVALGHVLAAAEDACARRVAGEVVDLFRRALELLDASEEVRRAGLLLDLGAAEREAGDLVAARATFERVVAQARALDDARLLARAVLALHDLGIPDPGRDGTYELDLIEDAQAALAAGGVPPGDPLAIRVLAAGSRLRAHLTRADDDVVDASRQAVDLARTAGDDETLGFSLLAHHDTIWAPGTAPQRAALAEEMSEVARRGGDTELGLQAALLTMVALLEQGEPAALDQADRLELSAERARSLRFRYLARSRRGTIATLTGRFAQARTAIDSANAFGEELGEVDRTRLGREQEWLLALLEGDDTEVDRLLERYALEDAAVSDHPLLLTAGWRGDVAQTRSRAAEVSVEAVDYPRMFTAARLCIQVEAAIASGRDEAADEVRAELEPLRDLWAVVAGGGTVYGPYVFWLARLDAARQRWDDAVAGFEGARRAAERLGARPWSVEAGVRLAQTLVARGGPGDTDRSAALLAEVIDQATALGMRSAVTRARDLAAGLETRDGSDGPREPSHATEDDPSADDHSASGRPRGGHEEFRFDGQVWHLGFADRTVQVPDAKGLRDLHVLLGLPGQEVSVADLVNPEGGEVVRTGARLGGDAVLDARAKAEYRQRLTVLGEQIEQALDSGDDDRAAELDSERGALLDELRRTTGLGGRSRRLGDDAERARKTVTARIRDSLRRLDERHPELAEHLRASVSTGVRCSYRPAREVRWQL